MKPLQQACPPRHLHPEVYGDEDYKDVFYPTDRTGELAMAVQVPSAFENAGYKIRQWGKDNYHPVWILRARQETAPRFRSEAQFIEHVLQVLRSADVQARKGDLITDRSRDRIMVSFLWPLPAASKRKRRQR